MLGLLTNKAALIEGHGKIAQYYTDIDANFDQDKVSRASVFFR